MSLRKKSIDDLGSLAGQRVLMRVDFNVPMKGGHIEDDFRIRSAVPSIKKLISSGARLILCSHLGRPEEKGYEEKYSLKPVAAALEGLVEQPVAFAADAMAADEAVAALQDGQILLLENVRFTPAEGAKKAADRKPLADKLVSYCDVYVSDAFGTAHRESASMYDVPRAKGAGYAGYLMRKEIDAFHRALATPKRPLVTIVGGAKVSDKIALLKNFISALQVDTILVGGAMAYTFLAAEGKAVGKSLCEKEAKGKDGETTDILKVAREIQAEASARGVRFVLPIDHAVADEFGPAKGDVETVDEIPDGKMALDIGPKTIALYQEIVAAAGTVIWNGPMGAFEQNGFERGTFAIVNALADATKASGLVSVVGGGDSASAADKSGRGEELTHISTGGGAALELLEGKVLPGIAALSDA